MSERRRELLNTKKADLIISSYYVTLEPASGETGSITIRTSDGSLPTDIIYTNYLSGCTYSTSTSNNIITITFTSTVRNTSTTYSNSLGRLVINDKSISVSQRTDYKKVVVIII